MLGKTHVVGTLALAHLGLLGYTSYVNHGLHTSQDGKAVTAPKETSEILGFTIGAPLSLLDYLLVFATVCCLVLLLLRWGKKKYLLGYALGIVAGLFALRVVSGSTYPFELALVLLAFTFGSLLPDIDSEESTIGRYVKPISRAIPHRTITHTIWAVALLAGLGWYFDSVYLVALALGYFLHIAEDSFSRQGICWLYPIVGSYETFSGGGTRKSGRKPVLSYRTGGTGETIMFYGAVVVHVLCAGWFLWLNLA